MNRREGSDPVSYMIAVDGVGLYNFMSAVMAGVNASAQKILDCPPDQTPYSSTEENLWGGVQCLVAIAEAMARDDWLMASSQAIRLMWRFELAELFLLVKQTIISQASRGRYIGLDGSGVYENYWLAFNAGTVEPGLGKPFGELLHPSAE
jgi:hypothetical protein